jgi:hypothetical protein
MTSRKWTLLHKEEYGQDQKLKLGLVEIGSLDDAIWSRRISKSKTYKNKTTLNIKEDLNDLFWLTYTQSKESLKEEIGKKITKYYNK